jgi:hypothetical protein
VNYYRWKLVGLVVGFFRLARRVAGPAGSPVPRVITLNSTYNDDTFMREFIGGGGWTRTNDLRIMSRQPVTDSTQVQQDGSANSGKILQNPQPPRNKKGGRE